MKNLIIVLGILLLCAAVAFGSGKEEVSTYTNEEYGFSFTYPKNFKEVPVVYPGEILRLAILNEYKVPVLTASVKEKPADVVLSEIPRKVVAFMKASMPDTSGYTIINEDLIPLKDGTEALTIEFSWLLGDKTTLMETSSIIVFKDEYQITITGNTIRDLGFPVAELTKICKTLELVK